MLQKLDQEKYVSYSPYKGVVLTSKGRLLAKTLESRHYALKKFLMMIGVSEEKAERDACEIEHKIDPDTSEKLTKFIEFIQSAPKVPPFLQNFRHYCRTGEHPSRSQRKKELI